MLFYTSIVQIEAMKEKKKSSIELLWKDRKRILGMPISFTRYSLSEDRLFLQTGFFTSRYEEILLYRVRDLQLKRTLGQKIFGVGSVMVTSSDKTLPKLELKNVKHSFEVKELLHEQVEKMKLARKVRVNEMSVDCDCDHDHDEFDEDEFDENIEE